MNRLPHIAHSLAAASASARALSRAARPSCTAAPGFHRSYSSAFQHGLQPFPFGFTPVHRSSAPSGHNPEAYDPSQPQTPVQIAQALAPELVDEIQLASALDAAAAVAASGATSATKAAPEYFDSPTAALDSAAAAADAADSADPSTAPNLSWFVDPAATDMLPLWQRNLLTSAADTAIAERSATAAPAHSLDDLLLASDGKLTPRILSEYLARHGGHDVVVLDTAARSDVTDSIVIATASSTAHMVSLASKVHAFIKEQISALVTSHEEREAAVAAISVEGLDCDDWVLLDLGRVFVHVMTSEGRCEYDLDGMWGGKSMAKKEAELVGAGDWEQAEEMASRRTPPGPVVFDEEPQGIQLRL